jgi:hypothetical protein
VVLAGPVEQAVSQELPALFLTATTHSVFQAVVVEAVEAEHPPR